MADTRRHEMFAGDAFSDTRCGEAIDGREMTAAVGVVMELAAAQHCVVTTAALAAHGIGPSAIRRLVRAGVLRRLHQGVYLAGPAVPPHARAMAALLACGRGAALSHRTAGELWGFLPAIGGPIDVTRPGTTRTHDGVRVHRSRLEQRDVGRRHEMAVSRPARTLLDLAVVVGPRELDRALEEAQILRLVSLAELRGTAERAGPNRACGRFAARSAASTRHLRSPAQKRSGGCFT